MVVFGLVFLIGSCAMGFAFISPFISGKETTVVINNIPTQVGPSNLGPLMFPAIFLGIFILIGAAITYAGVTMLTSKGPWFIGTPKRLIICNKNVIRSVNWGEFTGNITITGPPEDGDIVMEMRSGHMQSRGRGPAYYVPDTIYIGGIRGALTIAETCRKRIKENTVQAGPAAPSV